MVWCDVGLSDNNTTPGYSTLNCGNDCSSSGVNALLKCTEAKSASFILLEQDMAIYWETFSNCDQWIFNLSRFVTIFIQAIKIKFYPSQKMIKFLSSPNYARTKWKCSMIQAFARNDDIDIWMTSNHMVIKAIWCMHLL